MEKVNRKAYLLGSREDVTVSFGKSINIGHDYVLTFDDKNLDYCEFTFADKKIIMLGVFVDCRNAEFTDNSIIENLMDAWRKNFNILIEESKYLAGHYIMITVDSNDIYVFPDACATYGISYMYLNNNLILSSNPKILADLYDLSEDPKAIIMKNNTNIGEALPNDRTMYSEIKMILPNHYLRIKNFVIERTFPITSNLDSPEIDEVCEATAKYLKNIVLSFIKRKKMCLPLTSGKDSRTILAAIGKENISEIPCYTYYHKHFSDNTGDIAIPKLITDDFKINYSSIVDVEAPVEWIEYYNREIEEEPEIFTPGLCYTYNSNSNLKGRYFLSGGISTLGRTDYGNSLPEFLCTPSFLLTKTHNSSIEAYREVKKWLKEIKPYCKKSGISAYDMFYWEYRCGRWDQRTHLLIDASIDMLCPFNCSAILAKLILVSRKLRKKSLIHQGIIEILWPELLNYPFNPDDKLYRIITKYRYLYWILTYLKWVKETILRKIRK